MEPPVAFKTQVRESGVHDRSPSSPGQGSRPPESAGLVLAGTGQTPPPSPADQPQCPSVRRLPPTISTATCTADD